MANFWVQVAGAIELDLSTYELANHDSSESRGLRHKDDTTRGSRDREPAQSSDRVALTARADRRGLGAARDVVSTSDGARASWPQSARAQAPDELPVTE
jgi:hypothetical protein